MVDTLTNNDASPDSTPASAPPGMWPVLLGMGLAVLGPLVGFLFGTTVGSVSSGQDVNTMAHWLIGGLMFGGLGVLIAFLGGMRWVRSLQDRPANAHLRD